MSSDEPPTKRIKKHDFKKNKNYYNQQNNRKFIEPGQRGFLATCNYKERGCIRECYNILNHYADELYGPIDSKINEETPHEKSEELKDDGTKKTFIENDNDDDDADIADDLQKEIQNLKSNKKNNKYRFQVVDTGTSNCLFIKTTLSDPIELGLSIVKDIAETKKQQSRFLIRLVPIGIVTRANLKDIIDSAGALFDQYFLKNPKTFSIIFNKRYNNEIKRDEIIKELAEMVSAKNIKNKVDLKNAEYSVIVEIIKGLCCLSVVPNYLKYKKYNLIELAAKDLTDNSEDETIEQAKKHNEKDSIEKCENVCDKKQSQNEKSSENPSETDKSCIKDK